MARQINQKDGIGINYYNNLHIDISTVWKFKFLQKLPSKRILNGMNLWQDLDLIQGWVAHDSLGVTV